MRAWRASNTNAEPPAEQNTSPLVMGCCWECAARTAPRVPRSTVMAASSPAERQARGRSAGAGSRRLLRHMPPVLRSAAPVVGAKYMNARSLAQGAGTTGGLEGHWPGPLVHATPVSPTTSDTPSRSASGGATPAASRIRAPHLLMRGATSSASRSSGTARNVVPALATPSSPTTDWIPGGPQMATASCCPTPLHTGMPGWAALAQQPSG